MNFERIIDIPDYAHSRWPDKKVLWHKVGGKWEGLSMNQVMQKAERIATWLLGFGLQKGDMLAYSPAICKIEWLALEFACQQIGLAAVPIHTTSNIENVKAILEETEASLFVVLDEERALSFDVLKNEIPTLRNIYHLDKNKKNYFPPLHDAVEINKERLTLAKEKVATEDLCCIIYTSGTSGHPKGVMLTHSNLVSNIKAVLSLLPVDESHRVLSFLPFSHVFERTVIFTHLASGVEIYLTGNRESMMEDFASAKPILCTSVPRILEKMHEHLLETRAKSGFIEKSLINWALKIGQRYSFRQYKKPTYWMQVQLLRLLVYRRWQRPLGSKIKYILVGASSLQPYLGKLFSAAGIQVLEGYGMSETSPAISINRYQPGLSRLGTVGIVIPGVEVKIDAEEGEEDGEILVKGPNVMKGYFKKPEETAAAFTADGWLKTGDVGRFVHKRFLKITDRKKDIFKTSSGKYIAPQELENKLKASDFIEQALIIGFHKPYVSALLLPNFVLLEAWCKEQDIHWTSPQYMAHNIKVVQRIQDELDILNEALPNYKNIRKFTLCFEDWEAGAESNSVMGKMIRSELLEKFKKEIGKMYL